MKRRVQQILALIIILLILCPSFCISAYAYADSDHSKYYDEEDESYRDSYIYSGNTEDSSLIFFPPFPESSYSDYIIVYDNDVNEYSLVLLTSSHAYSLYFHKSKGTDWFPNLKAYDVYVYDNISRLWVFSYNQETNTFSGGPHWSDAYIIDSSCKIESGSLIKPHIYNNVTGYRFYWKLIRVEKFLLNQVNNTADYILANEILRICVLLGFCGELFVYVIILIKKLGVRRNNDEED